MFCREQAAHFETKRQAFDDLGVSLAAIGNGNAAMAQAFIDQFRITFPVFTDPGRRAYEAAGMHYGLGIGLGTFKHAVRALSGGFLQGRTKGHASQQGGVMVIDTAGEVRFAHRESGPGEHLPIADLVRTVRELEL